MTSKHDKPIGHVLGSKPSSAFSTHSSAGSATSAGTSRSGGSRLLFGEINTSSNRSSEVYAPVQGLVPSESSILSTLWLQDDCRETILSYLSRSELADLRCVCREFSKRAAPALFQDISITFRENTFRPSRLAGLDEIGFHVKTLRFRFPHSSSTLLPPLVDPQTGEQLSFRYTPQAESPTCQRPKFGNIETTMLLRDQWPQLFHAATNVPAFIRAFSALPNLQHLKISCPGFDKNRRFQRNIVDYALISVRMAVERNNLDALNTLTLSPMHPGGFLSLAPPLGKGAPPRSAARWARIQKLIIRADTLRPLLVQDEPDYVRVLQTYLRIFQPNLETLKFQWVGDKAQVPIMSASLIGDHPAAGKGDAAQPAHLRERQGMQSLRFGKLRVVDFDNVMATSAEMQNFIATHKSTMRELDCRDVIYDEGTWNQAAAYLNKITEPSRESYFAEIPIMLSPTSAPSPMARMEMANPAMNGRRTSQMSRWLPTRNKVSRAPSAARKMREGLLGCEEHLKKVFRGSSLPWR